MSYSKNNTVKRVLSILLIVCVLITVTQATTAISAKATNYTIISKVEINDITVPAAGEVPDFNGTVPNGSDYHLASNAEIKSLGYDTSEWINGIRWNDNEGVLTKESMFLPENTYWFDAIVVPNEGCTFADDISYKINGNPDLVDLDYTEHNGNHILVSSNDLAFEYKEIDTVDVFDIEMPVIGESPDFTGSLPADAKYHFATPEELEELEYGFVKQNINGIWWAKGNQFLNETSVFEKGENYSIGLALIPNIGYKFIDDVKCTINGSDENIELINSSELDLYYDAANLIPGYRVTFDANGGSCRPSSSVTRGGKLKELPTPSRDGYTFDGWFTEKDGGEAVSTDKKYTDNTTIFAHWTPNAAEPHTHKPSAVAAVAPTCTEAGSKPYYTCECGQWFEDEACTIEIKNQDSVIIPALGHDYSKAWSKDDKNHWHSCANCKDKADVAVHSFGEWKETKPPTKTEKGEKQHECSVCGYVGKAEIATTGSAGTTNPNTHPTGDGKAVTPWILMLILSFGAATVVARTRKQRQE